MVPNSGLANYQSLVRVSLHDVRRQTSAGSASVRGTGSGTSHQRTPGSRLHSCTVSCRHLLIPLPLSSSPICCSCLPFSPALLLLLLLLLAASLNLLTHSPTLLSPRPILLRPSLLQGLVSSAPSIPSTPGNPRSSLSSSCLLGGCQGCAVVHGQVALHGQVVHQACQLVRVLTQRVLPPLVLCP